MILLFSLGRPNIFAFDDLAIQRGMRMVYHHRKITRELFEKYYPGQAGMVADFWMPNKRWEGCDVNDPSARVLSNYGASGK